MANVSAEMKECLETIYGYKKGAKDLDESTVKVTALSGLSEKVVRAFLTNVKRDNIVQFPQKFRQRKHGTKLN